MSGTIIFIIWTALVYIVSELLFHGIDVLSTFNIFGITAIVTALSYVLIILKVIAYVSGIIVYIIWLWSEKKSRELEKKIKNWKRRKL